MFPVSVYTLGCKLNQLESEAIVDAFRAAAFPVGNGFSLGNTAPGLVIVNTCTVTSKADQKARRLIRKALRDNPDSCVVVTGCYARLDSNEIKLLEEEAGAAASRRLFVCAEKSSLLGLPAFLRESNALSADLVSKALESWFGEGGVAQEAAHPEDAALSQKAFAFKPEEFTFHSRGYLKIQDGCDNHCNYCRVRLARGPSVSLPRETVLERLRLLEGRGCAEVVITGVNITQYRDSGSGLAELLEYLLNGSSTIALRLASLEPECIDKRLASVLAHPRICPHFHLSIQSGSDAVLRAMGRAYTAKVVLEGAALLCNVKDNPFLACDIIAGFPGETESDFEQTRALCAQIGFAWIHAFPYSKRPGTPAFDFPGSIREGDISHRVETLTKLALQGRRSYAQSWLGRELSAVMESGGNRAVSENYLKLVIEGSGEFTAGTSIRCTPVSLCDNANGECPDAVAVCS